MTLAGEDALGVTEACDSLGQLAELIAPVHRIEDAVVLVVALPDIEAEGYVAQVLCELETLDSGSQRTDRCEVVGHEESEAEGAVAPPPICPSEEIRKPFALLRVFLLFSGGKSIVLAKKKAPLRSGISLSTHVVLKTRYINPNIHVRRY